MAKQCIYKKNDGSQCGGYAIENSKFCFFHDPDRKNDRKEAQILGGKNRSRTYYLNYLLSLRGHLINNATGVCILCMSQYEGQWCDRGRSLSGDKLDEYMDEHPYLYVLFVQNNNLALNSDYWWIAINDTRNDGPEMESLVLTTSEKHEPAELPERPPRPDLDEVDALVRSTSPKALFKMLENMYSSKQIRDEMINQLNEVPGEEE